MELKVKTTMNKDFFLSVIAVVSNDSDIIPDFIDETIKVIKKNYVNYELLIIDDGSTDKTKELMGNILKKNKCIRYLALSREFGIEVAISAGLDTCIGDVVVLMDPEKDPPEIIPDFVEKVRKTNSIVFGINTDINKILPWYYRLGKWIYHKMIKYLSDFYPPKNASYFIGLSRQHLNAIIQIKNRSKFLRIFSSQIGFNKIELPYSMKLRRTKPKRKPLGKNIRYAIDGITTNSVFPLKFVSALSFISAFVTLFYSVYVLLVRIFKNNVASGWASSSLETALAFFVVFITLGVISEYLIRIIEESKERPLYYISEDKNSSVMIVHEDRRRNIKNKDF